MKKPHPKMRLSVVSGFAQLATVDLFLLDALEQRLEVPFAKTVVPFTLDKLEEDRPDDSFRKYLQQNAGFAAIDDPAVQSSRGDLVSVAEPVKWTGRVVDEGSGGSDTWLISFNGAAELLPALASLERAAPDAAIGAATEEFRAANAEWPAGTLVLRGVSAAEARVMAQKIPERLEIIDDMPRNPTGKILKQALRERFAEAPQSP